MKVLKGGGGGDCWGYSRFRLWEGGGRGGGEVVEILLVYTSIMGEGVYKPSMLYAKAMVLILHILSWYAIFRFLYEKCHADREMLHKNVAPFIPK